MKIIFCCTFLRPYLDAENLIKVALQEGCQAVHPGALWMPTELITAKRWESFSVVKVHVQGLFRHVQATWAMKKDAGCLVYIGDYTTQLCGDYNKPLQGSLLDNQYNGKYEVFFCDSLLNIFCALSFARLWFSLREWGFCFLVRETWSKAPWLQSWRYVTVFFLFGFDTPGLLAHPPPLLTCLETRPRLGTKTSHQE